MEFLNERFLSLNHVKWECKYHIIITPKYRKKILTSGSWSRKLPLTKRNLTV